MPIKPEIKCFKSAVEFDQYVKNTITAKDYENLPEYLNTSATWFRRLMDNPALMNERQVRMMGKVLEREPWSLILEYGLGIFKMPSIEAIGFYNQSEAGKLAKMLEGDPTAGSQPVEVVVTKS